MSAFNFGAPKTTTANSTAFGIGTPSTTTSTFNFGAPANTTAPLLNFGTTTAQNTGFGFGTTSTAQTTGTNFGATATTTATALTFGTPATQVVTFGLGTTTTTTAATGLSFGTSTPTTTPALNFGAPATTTTPVVGFGSTPIATSATTPFSFGLSNTNVPTTTVSTNVPTFGLGGGSFAFAKPTTTTTTASLNFGTTTTTLSTGGLFGKTPVSTATAATAPSTFIGLGGLDVSATQPKPGDAKQDVKVKETQVPDMIVKTLEDLKNHIKLQKSLSSDIGRTSASKLINVTTEVANLKWSLQEIANSVESNYNHIKLLRKETTKNIQALEMSQRTQDTPPGLQFEYTAPFQFFLTLVAKYEQDLITFRQQIVDTEQHMRSLENPRNISPDDLKRGFKHLNESFISLAGRLNEIHQEIETQKELYLNLRKYRLRDPTNVFAKLDNVEKKVDTSGITAGPTPFSNITAMTNFSKSYNNSNTNPSGNATTQSAK